MSLFEEIRKIVCEQLRAKTREVKAETSIINDSEVNFIDRVELIMTLEAKFNIEIPDEDADEMKTVGDVVSYIENKIKQLPKSKEE